MLKNILNKFLGRKTENIKPEPQPEPVTEKRGKGHWKTDKYTLTQDKGERYRFNYRFNENEKLEFICKCYKNQEAELIETIEALIFKGYNKKEVKEKMKRKFNLKGGKKKPTTRTGKMNSELSWNKDKILLYNGKKTNITPKILAMFCTFHSNCNSNYDLIDLINQQYKYDDLLQSAVSFICINYNSLNLQKLIEEGMKI